ncbi:hypothetical protein [Ochrobactrum sp. EDr1-4]|uniref:hypothetical protein n=1 Tax=Ochrobactrum sp. EDr1-4 TaxID=3368622 RepID=UPI003BA063B5
MKQIDHIPNEKRPPKWIWKAAWAVVALFWLLQWRDGFDWENIALGGITIGVLVAWAMEKTGGETPESWRSKPRRR